MPYTKQELKDIVDNHSRKIVENPKFIENMDKFIFNKMKEEAEKGNESIEISFNYFDDNIKEDPTIIITYLKSLGYNISTDYDSKLIISWE